MSIDVAFLPTDIRGELSNTTCIVLDIFRATTSIVTAISNGSKAILPVLSVEEANHLASQKERVLLAGERQSIKIEGFDFGNSPYEFSREKVSGKKIIMTTTNGTIAIRATDGAFCTLIGSFINASAVCYRAKQIGKDILIVCAGTDGLFSLEDALCAGFLIEILQLMQDKKLELTDSAYGTWLMYKEAKDRIIDIVRNSRNGFRLYNMGHAEDVQYCFKINSVDNVPEYRNGIISI